MVNFAELADPIPGISDTNRTRVELTHEYIKSCDVIWVVAGLSRVIDDSTVNGLLWRYSKVFKGKVCIVVTHTDDGISGEERNLVNHLATGDYDVQLWHELSEEAHAKSKEATKIRKKWKDAKRRKVNDKAKRRKVGELSMELSEKEDEVDALQRRSFAFLVKTRSTQVRDRLQQKFQDLMPAGKKLRVFCVSNRHYAVHRGAQFKGALLEPDETGIPEMRRWALGLAASGLLRALCQHQGIKIPLLLKDLDLWLRATHVKGKSELLDMAKYLEETLAFKMTQRVDGFSTEVSNNVSKVLKFSRTGAINAARAVMTRKRRKRYASIKAFVRREGNHSTKTCAKECWNEELIGSVVDSVNKFWPTLEDDKQELTDTLQKSILDSHVRSDTRGMACHLLGASGLDLLLSCTEAQFRPSHCPPSPLQATTDLPFPYPRILMFLPLTTALSWLPSAPGKPGSSLHISTPSHMPWSRTIPATRFACFRSATSNNRTLACTCKAVFRRRG